MVLTLQVWSFAVTLWEILEFGKVPYLGLANNEVYARVTSLSGEKLDKPALCSDGLYDVLLR